MARNYASKSRGIRLYGFDDFITALQKAESIDVDQAAKQCFDQCCDIVVEALDSKMKDADVPESLQSKVSTFRVYKHNKYLFSYGWGRADDETFTKVCYLNYGTPHRYVRNDSQRVQIDGKWVTVGDYRGKINPRDFISNAKRSAAQRMKKVQKDALKKIMDGLKK